MIHYSANQKNGKLLCVFLALAAMVFYSGFCLADDGSVDQQNNVTAADSPLDVFSTPPNIPPGVAVVGFDQTRFSQQRNSTITVVPLDVGSTPTTQAPEPTVGWDPARYPQSQAAQSAAPSSGGPASGGNIKARTCDGLSIEANDLQFDGKGGDAQFIFHDGPVNNFIIDSIAVSADDANFSVQVIAADKIVQEGQTEPMQVKVNYALDAKAETKATIKAKGHFSTGLQCEPSATFSITANAKAAGQPKPVTQISSTPATSKTVPTPAGPKMNPSNSPAPASNVTGLASLGISNRIIIGVGTIVLGLVLGAFILSRRAK